MSLRTIVLVIALAIQIVIATGLLIYEIKKKDLIGILGMIVTACGIVATVASLNPSFFNPLGFVPKFLPVEYHNGSYNEGLYYGGWYDGAPQGIGTLTYGSFGDGKYYCIHMDGREYKALSYTGGFNQGYREGEGAVTYEGGYRDEGIFYGVWFAGKKVFEGKRWLTTETFHGYRELELYAVSATEAEEHWLGEWVSVAE